MVKNKNKQKQKQKTMLPRKYKSRIQNLYNSSLVQRLEILHYKGEIKQQMRKISSAFGQIISINSQI